MSVARVDSEADVTTADHLNGVGKIASQISIDEVVAATRRPRPQAVTIGPRHSSGWLPAIPKGDDRPRRDLRLNSVAPIKRRVGITTPIVIKPGLCEG